MGYDGHNADAIVLDLEAVARPGLEALLDPVNAPANYKDAEKIAAKKQEKLQALIDRAALDVNLCRIVALGVQAGGVTTVTAFKTEAEEVEGLKLLAGAIDLTGRGGLRRIITFNGLHYDLLVLQQRARILGVRFPTIDVGAPWRNPNTDLMQVLSFNGATAKHSLDFYCRVFGIEDDPEDTDAIKAVTGADIGLLVSDGRWDLVTGHCRHDVRKTTKLAQRLGVL